MTGPPAWRHRRPGLGPVPGARARLAEPPRARWHALGEGLTNGPRARPGDGAQGRLARSGKVELTVLDTEGERFPFLRGEREHRAVRVLGVTHQVELLAVRLVWPAGGVSGDRDLDRMVVAGEVHGGIRVVSGEVHCIRAFWVSNVVVSQHRGTGYWPEAARGPVSA